MMNVFWLAIREETPQRGYWDQGHISRLLDHFECAHREVRSIPDGETEGAVVIIPARHQADFAEALSVELAKLPWCLAVLTGDEESVFPWRELKHPNMRVWVMSPKQGIHDDAANRIGSGFRYEQPDIIRDIGLQERDLDWFFSGQITHPIREQCAAQLRTMPGGKLFESKMFGQGLEHREYLSHMARAKFVPCPSGPATPDTFRLFEALDAGCVPISDNGAYWEYLFGEKPPFPSVSSWAVLPEMMPELLREWPHNANQVFGWWQNYKRRMLDKLASQIAEISGQNPPLKMQGDITVLLCTGPVSIHPSTRMIEETVESVRERLPQAEMIFMADGLSPDLAENKARYEEYVRRMLWKCNLEGIVPVVCPRHMHQTGKTKEALKLVRTEFVLYVEHDTPLLGEIDWEGLKRVVSSGYANTVRLHHETHILPDHQYLMLDEVPQNILGVPLIRTMQWSQRPHLSSTGYYRHIADKFFTEKPMFIEHVMYGTVLGRPWNEARLHIYAPEGSMLRSGHLNGRDYQGEL